MHAATKAAPISPAKAPVGILMKVDRGIMRQ
jgi:hypothetical protein